MASPFLTPSHYGSYYYLAISTGFGPIIHSTRRERVGKGIYHPLELLSTVACFLCLVSFQLFLPQEDKHIPLSGRENLWVENNPIVNLFLVLLVFKLRTWFAVCVHVVVVNSCVVLYYDLCAF